MKCYFYKTVFLSFALTSGFSQVVNMQLNSVITPGNYSAQQEIRLKPGMVGAPTGANQMRLFIDPSITAPSPYTSPGAFGTPPVYYVLDLSKPVGTIPYNYDITPVGSAMCSIPIETPMGTNNMKPNISLVYGSNSGVGNVGLGWNVGGISSIGRTIRTIYHDGAVEPLTMTNNDVFTIDGNRIIPTSGVNGANNTVYTTEQNMFYRITSFNSAGNGPEWFKVETKDGLTMEFGNSGDSRLIPNNNTVFEWKVSKIYDNFGNYILFEYYNLNGEAIIKEIRYTGNTSAGISPYNSIKFYYNEATEANTFLQRAGK